MKKVKSYLRKHLAEPEEIEKDFDLLSDELAEIIAERAFQLHKVERDRKEKVGTLYKVIFDTDPNPIFIIDTKSLKILDVNRRTEEYYKYTKEEFLKMSFMELGDSKDEEFLSRVKEISENQCVFFSKKKHY